MTALALALVACCAMVCGTVLAARRMTLRQHANLEIESQVSGLMEADANRRKELGDLRHEVASLRADMAVRSIA